MLHLLNRYIFWRNKKTPNCLSVYLSNSFKFLSLKDLMLPDSLSSSIFHVLLMNLLWIWNILILLKQVAKIRNMCKNQQCIYFIYTIECYFTWCRSLFFVDLYVCLFLIVSSREQNYLFLLNFSFSKAFSMKAYVCMHICTYRHF